MSKENVISDSLLSEAQAEFAIGNFWIAYNTKTYYLDNADMWFFRSKDEAIDFANDNISDREAFAVIHAESIASLLQQFPYGENIHLSPTEKELEELFQSFDWDFAYYDPLHDAIEADTDRDRDFLAKMVPLLSGWEDLYRRDPAAAEGLVERYWKDKPMQQYADDFITIKNDLMNEKNLDFLKSNIRNHGFGETLGPELEAQIRKGVTDFTLPYKTEVNKHEMEATLYFGKSDKSDLYFFNKYDTRLKNERDETVAQTFYINNGWGVTLKEAYNLLNGRAVHKELTNKEGEKYQAWIQLDFSAKDKHGNYERKQYHQNYGYDLKEAISFYPVKEMAKEGDAKDLLRSLERGNVQMVTIETPGKDIRVFVEANPQYKSVNVYDNKMNRLDQEQRQELMRKPELPGEKDQTKIKEKTKEQSLGTEEQVGKKSKGRKEKPGGEGNGLVTKNRTRSGGKGMSV